MTTQEEIREGIYSLIKDNCESASGWIGNKAYTVELILSYLKEQGVVLKVAGPKMSSNKWSSETVTGFGDSYHIEELI